jgi:hypothetical protein
MTENNLAFVMIEYYINGCIVRQKIVSVTQDQQLAYDWKMEQPVEEFINKEVLTVPAINLANITGITQINTQIYDDPGVFQYTPTAGAEYVMVELIGAGGGSGGIDACTPSLGAATGGGASGGYVKFMLTAEQIGAALFGEIGLGGIAGIGNINGGDGGDTTLATFNSWIARGGGGSEGSPIGTSVGSLRTKLGGLAGINDLGTGSIIVNLNGQNGGSSHKHTSGIWAGNGASTIYGSAFPANILVLDGELAPGVSAIGYGSGATGAAAWGGNTIISGGNGANGLAIFTEYV